MSEKVEHTAVKNIDPPRGCTCHPSDVYFPCQQHHAFWICENAWLKQREAALLAERDRLREALEEATRHIERALEASMPLKGVDGAGVPYAKRLQYARDFVGHAHALLKDTNQ